MEVIIFILYRRELRREGGFEMTFKVVDCRVFYCVVLSGRVMMRGIRVRVLGFVLRGF